MERPAPIFRPPDTAEIARRVDDVRRRMDSAGVDRLVVVDPDNVFYLTNFYNYVHERPFVLVVGSDGPLRFVAPEIEAPHVRVRAVGPVELVPYFEFPAPPGEAWSDRLAEVLEGATRVGVEPNCPLFVVEAVEAVEGGAAVAADAVEEARIVKSDYEVGRIAHASSIVSAGHAELLEGCKPGELAISLFAAVTRSMTVRMLGDIPHANMLASRFAAVVQPPSLSHDPHNFTDVFIALEETGPHVSVINCRVDGYGAEIERTFFLGSAPEAAHRPFEAMMDARRVAYERAVPGESMAEVDRAVRTTFERYGYLDRMLHRTGHSFGVTGHEAPFLAVGYDREIRPGMLFSIEPGIYLPGTGGFRHSDTVLITETGNVSLTDGPDTLDELVLAL